MNQDAEMFRAIKHHLNLRTFSGVSWGKCWYVGKLLGYELSRFQQREVDRWLSSRSQAELDALRTLLVHDAVDNKSA